MAAMLPAAMAALPAAGAAAAPALGAGLGAGALGAAAAPAAGASLGAAMPWLTGAGAPLSATPGMVGSLAGAMPGMGMGTGAQGSMLSKLGGAMPDMMKAMQGNEQSQAPMPQMPTAPASNMGGMQGGGSLMESLNAQSQARAAQNKPMDLEQLMKRFNYNY